jgi:hypothetical protein
MDQPNGGEVAALRHRESSSDSASYDKRPPKHSSRTKRDGRKLMTGGSSSNGGSSHSNADRNVKSKRRKRKHKDKEKRRHSSKSTSRRRDSVEGTSAESDSDSSSRSSEDERHRKRRKKRKHRRKDEDDDRRRRKGSSDDEDDESRRRKKKHRGRDDGGRKKSKRDKNDKVAAGTMHLGAGSAPSAFGKYGIIRADPDTMARCRRSFEVWLSEVKGMHLSQISIPRHEVQKYFEDYVEDFNTATLPHVKYYDYDTWERQEYYSKAKGADGAVTSNTAQMDEIRHQQEQMQKKQMRKEAERAALLSTFDAAKVQEMKHQSSLRAEMQVAFKTGDQATYRRLKEKLEPDEKK